jgi:hypothetical protein
MSATTTRDVFPQLFVYDGAVNATFTNDLFNVGAGALKNPAATIVSDGDLINSYCSGESEITVPATARRWTCTRSATTPTPARGRTR